MTNDETPEDGAPRVTGEVPVVRAISDVPADVLDELTTAFEKHSVEVPSRPAPVVVPEGETETVLIDGFDLVSDDELTHARKPPLVIEDTELTGPVLRPTDDSDGVVKRDRRFRLRRIAVRREEGRRRLRVLAWVGVPVLAVGIVLAVLA
jgi:hypothetical protein